MEVLKVSDEDKRDLVRKIGDAVVVAQIVGSIIMKNNTLEDVKRKIHKNGNHNFNFNSLSWSTKVWLAEICQTFDEKLDKMEEELNELKEKNK